MSGYWLALDQGGHAGRAMAFDESGQLLAEESRDVATHEPAAGWFEQDPEAVVRSLTEPLAAVTSRLRNQRCLGAGLATQRSSIACWDRTSGEALSPVISWRDTRRADWLEALALDEDWIREKTGLRVSAHYGASKLRWCLDELPAVRQAQLDGRLAFGPLASFLSFRLTRERTLAADPANASRTLLWDLAERRFSNELIERFGLPAEALPPPAPLATPLGTLDVDGTPALRLVTGDQSAALFAGGDPHPDDIFINAGTGAFVLRLGTWPNEAQRLLTSLVVEGRDGPRYAMEGTVNAAGSALDAVATELGIPDGVKRLDEFDQAIEDPPIYLNGRSGLGSPWWQPVLASGWLDPGTPEARLLGVLESVVFALQTNIELITRHTGGARRIVLSGGLSRSRAFARRLADLSGLPVVRPAVSEATGLGLAFLVSGGTIPCGEEDSSEPVLGEPCPALSERYRRWRAEMARATGLDPV